MEFQFRKNGPASISSQLRAAYRSRSMIFLFARRDIKNQFSQTYFGIVSLIFQPLTSIIVFTVLFGMLIKVNTGPVAYPVFAFSGLTIWLLFSSSFYEISSCLIKDANLIKKVSFPKLVLPLSKIVYALFNFSITFLLLILALLLWGVIPNWHIIFLPVILLITVFTAFSLGIWLSSLTVRYRDLLLFVPHLIGFGTWLTPVFYPESLIPGSLAPFLYLNPIAACIAYFRFFLFGGAFPAAEYLWSLAIPLVLLVSGIIYFTKIEHNASDYL